MTEREDRRTHDLVPLILGGAIFIQTLDSQSLATILPAMAGSLDVSPVDLNLAITMYYVGAAAFLPISGWCADRFGTRRVFQVSIVAFSLCSLLCGLASTATELTLIRAATGATTAGLMPVGRLLLIRTSERSELVRRLTYLTIPTTIGPLLGPVIGGAFATFGSWRWVFLMNVPIGLIGLILVTRFIPDFREDEKRRLDIVGALVAGIGLSAGLLWIDGLSQLPNLTQLDIAAAIVMTVCAVIYVFHARRSQKPILDFSLTRIPTFNAGVVGGFFFRLANGCQALLLALLFQTGFGMTAFMSGALVVSTAVGALLVRWLTAHIVRMLGFKRLLLFNGAICAVLGIAPLLLSEATPLFVVGALLFLRGFFRSLQLTTLNVVSYVDVPRESMSDASSLAATTQQLTHALSVALAMAVVAAWSGGGEISISAIGAAFVVVAVVGLFSLLNFSTLPANAGADVSGRT